MAVENCGQADFECVGQFSSSVSRNRGLSTAAGSFEGFDSNFWEHRCDSMQDRIFF